MNVSNIQIPLGLVITTFGTPDYVQLALEVIKSHNIKMPILIHDDSSGDVNLINLCKKYRCEFMSTTSRYGHLAGDVKALQNALMWASEKNIEVLVKMSRRFIPLFDWTKSLIELIKKAPHRTYGNRCEHFRYPLRTECVGYTVKDWINNLNEMQKIVNKNRCCVENDIFNIAKSFSTWHEIGNNRMRKMSNILWHDCCPDYEYIQELKKYRQRIPKFL